MSDSEGGASGDEAGHSAGPHPGIPWPKTVAEVTLLRDRLRALAQRVAATPLQWRMRAEAKAAELAWSTAVLDVVDWDLSDRIPGLMARKRRTASKEVLQALCNYDYFKLRECFVCVAAHLPPEEARRAIEALGRVRWIRKPRL
jgi:hypothetical protein